MPPFLHGRLFFIGVDTDPPYTAQDGIVMSSTFVDSEYADNPPQPVTLLIDEQSFSKAILTALLPGQEISPDAGANISGNVKVDHGNFIGRDLINNIRYDDSKLSVAIKAMVRHQFQESSMSSYLNGIGLLIRVARIFEEEPTQENWSLLIGPATSLYKRANEWLPLIRFLGQEILSTSAPTNYFAIDSVASILKTLERAHSTLANLFQDMSFYSIIVELCKPDDTRPIDSVLPPLFGLYDRYGADVRDIVVGSIIHLSTNDHPQMSRFRNLLAESLEAKPERRVILRHPALESLVRDCPQLDKYRSYTYLWPNKNHPCKPINSREAEWLRLVGLDTHPFPVSADDYFAELPPERWVPPVGWDKIEEANNFLALYGATEDTVLSYRYLLSRFRQPEFFKKLPTFSIHLDTIASADNRGMTDVLLENAAITWCNFLAMNREAFEEMPDIDQQMLAELLTWSVGSFADLQGWMRKRARDVYAIEEDYFKPILSRIQPIAAKLLRSHPPKPLKRLSWLSVRPPGYDQTYLVGNLHQGYTSHYENLVNLIPEINEYQIFVKLLGCERDRSRYTSGWSIAGIPTTLMYWSEDTLRQVLDNRVWKASGNRFPFAALLEPMNDPEGRLAHAANGSLSRLLQLGHRLIERHIQQSEITREISEATFEATLREWAGMK